MQRDEPSPQDLAVDPPVLRASVRGQGSPTVVLEAGGGENSSVWAEVEPEVRGRQRVRTMIYDIPTATPIVDIVAERTWVETAEETEPIRRAHRDFVAASPHRRAVLAEGSGHHVMRDRPDVVLDAIAEVVASVRPRQ